MKRSKKIAALMCAAMLVQPVSALAEEPVEVLKTESRTFKYNGESTSTTYYYKENGLLDRVESAMAGESAASEVITPEYEYDEHGNPLKASVVEIPGDDSSKLELQMETVYEGDEPASVTCHVFAADGNEIVAPANGLSHHFETIYSLQQSLAGFTGYENCVVTFAGYPNVIEKKDGKVVAFDAAQYGNGWTKEEYNENGYVTYYESYSPDQTDSSQTFTYDEMGKITSVAMKSSGAENEVTFSYEEGKDEDGQTTYTAEEGLIYTVDENGIIRRKEATYNAPGKEVREYDELGRKVRVESAMDDTEDAFSDVIEYSYY